MSIYELFNKTEINLHPKLDSIIKQIPNNISSFKNIIVYGPENSGKYSQTLRIISKFSASSLKYEKKLTITAKDLRESFVLKMSDVHYEIDMFLLMFNSKLIWHTIYQHIVDIISLQKIKHGIILCKNFHVIHNDLLDVFYSYMQTNFTPVKLHFILITEELSFIPHNIINCCDVLHVPKPYKINIIKCNKIKTNVEFENQVVETIWKSMENPTNFVATRNALYNIFIYQLNVHVCIWILCKKMQKKDSNKMFQNLMTFFHGYNNNYRHIYHIELFIYNCLNI
jgi:Cdc6-like AAA superfamily ATPase